MQELTVSAEPFPHAIADGFWPDELLREVRGEFPDDKSPAWRSFDNPNEIKRACEDPQYFGPATLRLLEVLRSREFCAVVGRAFGIRDPQPHLKGGGYHSIPYGGRLELHVDFNRGPNGLHRRANCLVYLNEGWVPGRGGQLVLGGTPSLVLAPAFNRTVLFATSERSYHGHPVRWNGTEPRRSFAIYYFSTEAADEGAPDHSTVWSGS